MECIPDWLRLWETLSRAQMKGFSRKKDPAEKDFWKDKARHFDDMVKKRWSHPDSSRSHIQSVLKKNPGSTLLDIGAGTGAWSLFMAPDAKHVTAVEPSEAMGEVLRENMTRKKITNIRIVKGVWPWVDLPPHDYALASHSMYGEADFCGFIRKMTATARETCFLVLRVPFTDAVMAKAAEHVWGQPYDSPNFQVAYNALLQMGIYPNVLMETGKAWDPWINNSMAEALSEVKNRLEIHDTTAHDPFLKKLLAEHLVEKDGKVVWPVGNRSALVWWEVS